MVSYNSSDVVQCLRQYEMFANSLKLIKSSEEKGMIVKQLTKLENKILALTNEIYEEEYYALANKECGLLDEEKKRITMLIDLINQRLSYIEKRCNNHYELTGESIDVGDVLGADTLDSLEDRVKIIDKYSKNIRLEKELNNDVKSLNSKISLASEKIDINKSLNIELEATFKKVMSAAFEKMGFYQLADSRDDIEYAYYETEKSLTLAQLNLETAKTSPANILADCQEMLDEVTLDYVKFKEQMSILKLMDIFSRDLDGYEELLEKRKEVNEVIKHIKNQEFLDMVMDTVTKQYSTILMEQQDINTFNDLVLERERKLEALDEIQEENNSDEFQSVLKVLIENERKKQEKILEEQKRIEEEEKKKKLEIERKKQEEILKRQKIIEEARKKEIEKRTKQLLEEQQKSILQSKKKEQTVSFETIKDISNNDDADEQDEVIHSNRSKNDGYSLNDIKDETTNGESSNIEEEEVPLFKNKVDIEKELFEEFNNEPVHETIEDNDSERHDDDLFSRLDEKLSNNKLPDISIDEYMKNFDENKVSNDNNLFDDDVFPSIPM